MGVVQWLIDIRKKYLLKPNLPYLCHEFTRWSVALQLDGAQKLLWNNWKFYTNVKCDNNNQQVVFEDDPCGFKTYVLCWILVAFSDLKKPSWSHLGFCVHMYTWILIRAVTANPIFRTKNQHSAHKSLGIFEVSKWIPKSRKKNTTHVPDRKHLLICCNSELEHAKSTHI